MSFIVETGKVLDWLISQAFGASPRTHKTCMSLCYAQKDLQEYTANEQHVPKDNSRRKRLLGEIILAYKK